jgi:hypothetical protein
MRRRPPTPQRPVTGHLTTSGRQHWARRSPRQLARPASSGGGVTALVLLVVVGVVVALALGAHGVHLHLR